MEIIQNFTLASLRSLSVLFISSLLAPPTSRVTPLNTQASRLANYHTYHDTQRTMTCSRLINFWHLSHAPFFWMYANFGFPVQLGPAYWLGAYFSMNPLISCNSNPQSFPVKSTFFAPPSPFAYRADVQKICISFTSFSFPPLFLTRKEGFWEREREREREREIERERERERERSSDSFESGLWLNKARRCSYLWVFPFEDLLWNDSLFWTWTFRSQSLPRLSLFSLSFSLSLSLSLSLSSSFFLSISISGLPC